MLSSGAVQAKREWLPKPYRRLHVLLKREGYVINHKKLFRLYRVREACGAPPWRSQAGDRDQGTDDGSDGAQRPLVARLRVGKPKMVITDNGSELTSNAILTWADQTLVDWQPPHRKTRLRWHHRMKTYTDQTRDQYMPGAPSRKARQSRSTAAGSSPTGAMACGSRRV
jgi:hypothetical protein